MPDVADQSSLDVKAAAKIAAAYLLDLLGGTNDLADVRLEEVERDGGYWNVTLGYARAADKESAAQSPLVGMLRPRPPREYKVFRIDARTGEVESMKIRQP